MIKAQEQNDPLSCWNKAEPNERLFILLARDSVAPATIRFWVRERIRLGKNQPGDPQILEAVECARKMEGGDT